MESEWQVPPPPLELHIGFASRPDEAEIADCGSPLSSLSPSPPSTTPAPKINPKSHGPKRSPEHVARPPNAFMLYRSDFLKKRIIPANVEHKQHNLSRIIGQCWGRLTPSELKLWTDLARQKEEEHKIKYPHYQFKPEKRFKAKRRKAISKEEEIRHCTNLMATYIPDMTGPVINHRGSRPARPRKSRAKPRASEAERPARSTRSSRAHARMNVSSRSPESSAALESPVFMDPLLPPDTQPPSQKIDTAMLDPELEPPTVFALPSHIDWEAEDVSFPEVSAAPPEPTEMHRPLDAGAHIRQQFDIARRGVPFPTMAIDFQNAQALFNPSSFFASQSSARQTPVQSLDIPFTAENIEWQYQASNSTAGPSSDGLPLLSLLTGFEDFGALPDLSTPQPFPITLTASASMPLESLQLRAPVFDTPLNPLDTLTLSFDQRTLDAFAAHVGLDGQFDPFEQSVLLDCGFDASSGEMVKDIMNAEVCFTTVENVV